MKVALGSILVFFSIFSSFGHAATGQLDGLICPISTCTECSLTLNLRIKQAEYFDNESSHQLKQVSKSFKTRVFLAKANGQIPTSAFKLIFDRRNKTASLFEHVANQPEKVLYKNLKCR